MKDLISLFGKRLRRESIKVDALFPFFVATAWKDNLNLEVLQLKVTLRINVWTVCSVLIKQIWSPRLVWTSVSGGFCWKSSGKQRNWVLIRLNVWRIEFICWGCDRTYRGNDPVSAAGSLSVSGCSWQTESGHQGSIMKLCKSYNNYSTDDSFSSQWLWIYPQNCTGISHLKWQRYILMTPVVYDSPWLWKVYFQWSLPEQSAPN